MFQHQAKWLKIILFVCISNFTEIEFDVLSL